MEELVIKYYPYVILALVWTIPWKGVALWKSARRGHFIWFLIIFLFNTLALLEIFYLFFHRKKKVNNEDGGYVLDESNQIRPQKRKKIQKRSRRII